MKAVVLWSGGVESTSLLKWCLESTHWDIVAHHIGLRTVENRHYAEMVAVSDLVGPLSQIRAFEVSSSAVSVCDGLGICGDYMLIYPIGLAALRYHNAEFMLRGWCREDDRDGPPGPDGRWANQLRALQGCLPAEAFASTYCPWVNPCNWTKAEHIKNLGKLFELTHSCRTPDLHGKACGRCSTCQLLAKIRQGE